MQLSKTKAALSSLLLFALVGCNGGIQAGGESPTNNGGIAWIAMSGMLILTGIILWIILGRED